MDSYTLFLKAAAIIDNEYQKTSIVTNKPEEKDVHQRKIEFVSSFYSQIDDKVSEFKNCCKKGCSHCCYQSIEIFSIEKAIIGKYIKDNIDGELLRKIRKNVNKWLDYFDKNTPDKSELTKDDVFIVFRDQIVEDDIPCPFLIDRLCSIYPVRPMTCRTHFVQDSPNLCADDGLRNPCKISSDIREAGVLYVTTYTISEIYLLPYAVLDVLEIKRDVKQIESIILSVK